jgi:hypothetical protein
MSVFLKHPLQYHCKRRFLRAYVYKYIHNIYDGIGHPQVRVLKENFKPFARAFYF